MRHHPPAEQRGSEQADAEDAFVDEEEEATAAGFRHLADIGGGDGNLAAEADALDRAQGEKRGEIVSEGAGEAAEREERDAEHQRAQPADAVGDPAEGEGADQLPGVARRDQQPDLALLDMPEADHDRQHISDGQAVIRVEECRSADDDPGFDMPAGDRQAFDPRDDVGGVAAHDVIPPVQIAHSLSAGGAERAG